MWLKYKDHLYNLDCFKEIEILKEKDLFKDQNSKYHLQLTNMARDLPSVTIGPFGKGEAELYFEKIAVALETRETMWKFPENAEDLKINE